MKAMVYAVFLIPLGIQLLKLDSFHWLSSSDLRKLGTNQKKYVAKVFLKAAY